MLLNLFLLTAISLILSLLFTPIIRVLALRWNLVDLPDNKRKVHKKPIPRVGGVALTAAYFASCWAAVGLISWLRLTPSLEFGALKSIAPATLLIFLIGLADDIFGLKPWHKLIVEIVAAALVVSAGVHIGEFSVFSAHPLLGQLATVAWLIGCTNAVNLIDGLDGLASGVALVATVTILIASLMTGHMELTIAAAPLAGALLGFLVFNFNPASIFLGDCGSLVLGFLLGCFSVLWSVKTATLFGLTAPLMTLAIPLLDTTLAISRRFLSGNPIFRPDRSHIHHRLLARGLTQRRAVLSLYIAGVVAGALSLGLIWARNHSEALILVAFVCAVIVGIQQLGYVEFDAARKVLLRGGIRQGIRTELTLQACEQALQSANTAEECWIVIQSASVEIGIDSLRMRLGGRTFGQGARDAERSPIVSISISDEDWIELSLHTNPAGYPNALVPFAAVVRRVLADKRIHVAYPQPPTPFSKVLYETAPLSAQ